MRLAFACIVLAAFVLSNCSSDDGTRQAPRDPKDASTETGGRGGSGGSTAGSAGSGGRGGSGGSTGGSGGSTGGSGGSTGGSGGTTVDASADSGDAAAGTGGADGGVDSGVDAAACGLDDPCCANGVCAGSYQCLGDRCGCIRAIHGDLYLRTDGRVYTYSGTPTVIEQGTTGQPLENATEIFEGDEHGCALRSDGSVWCWALTTSGNGAGQLGNGVLGGATVVRQANPVLVAPTTDGGPATPLTGAVHINSGSSRSYLASTSCAIRQDTTLWCWGSLGNGGGGNIFNDGVPGNRPYAVQILANATTPLTGVSQVGLGRRHACVLRSGEVWCWAANINGPLGLGNETEQVYPTRVTLPGLAQQIGVGSDSTCARVAGGVYCWGSNHTGQLGVGTPTLNPGCSSNCSLLPKQVIDAPLTDAAAASPLTGVVDLNVVYHAACALRTDHSLYCWGAGTTDYASPLATNGTNILLHTSVGSAIVPGVLRVLTRDNVLRRSTTVLNQVCQ